MSRNDAIKVTHRNGSIVSKLLITICIFSIASCENSLVEAAKAIQEEAVSPRILVRSMDGMVIAAGGEFDFGDVSVGETKELASRY